MSLTLIILIYYYDDDDGPMVHLEVVNVYDDGGCGLPVLEAWLAIQWITSKELSLALDLGCLGVCFGWIWIWISWILWRSSFVLIGVFPMQAEA